MSTKNNEARRLAYASLPAEEKERINALKREKERIKRESRTQEEKDAINAQKRAKYEANAPAIREYFREYRKEYADKNPEYHNDYYHNNKDRIKKNKRKYRESDKGRQTIKDLCLRNRFGISLEQYEKMLAAQGGVCAICLLPPRDTDLAVDHNHQTGQIRGLLHRECNTMLGFAREQPSVLEAAISYLKAGGHPYATTIILEKQVKRKPGRPRAVPEDDDENKSK